MGGLLPHLPPQVAQPGWGQAASNWLHGSIRPGVARTKDGVFVERKNTKSLFKLNSSHLNPTSSWGCGAVLCEGDGPSTATGARAPSSRLPRKPSVYRGLKYWLACPGRCREEARAATILPRRALWRSRGLEQGLSANPRVQHPGPWGSLRAAGGGWELLPRLFPPPHTVSAAALASGLPHLATPVPAKAVFLLGTPDTCTRGTHTHSPKHVMSYKFLLMKHL